MEAFSVTRILSHQTFRLLCGLKASPHAPQVTQDGRVLIPIHPKNNASNKVEVEQTVVMTIRCGV
jgi:hypothetical protein